MLRAGKAGIAGLPLPGTVLLLLALLGNSLAVFEHFATGRDAQFYLGSYVAVAALLVWAVKVPNPQGKLCGALEYLGREMSMLIYILHIPVGKTVDWLAKINGWYGNQVYYLLRSAAILLLTVLLVLCIKTLQKRFSK